jgi:ABC-2 type transport system permease protein
VNLFSTPLKLYEWIVALMMAGLIKICITVAFGGFLVWLLYTLNVFHIGWAFLPFGASLVLSGWSMGFLSSSVMIYYGQRVQMLAWMTAYLFAPFCAVFYPLSALPGWAQVIGRALPMTYIFEGMREVLNTGVFSWKCFLMSIALNIVFLILTVSLFKWLFEKSRNKGLARLE